MPRLAFSRLTLFTTAALIAAAPAPASDPIGVFAVIDRVVLEPDATNPRTIQVWGVFAMADKSDRNYYHPAQRGYLYYTLSPQNPKATLAEWADFKAVAGTGQAIGWGSRFAEAGRIRRASEAPSSPDVYQLGFGLVKLLTAPSRAGIGQQLKMVPLPSSPADGASVRAGQVRLVARHIGDANARYFFRIEGPANKSENSAPIAAGKGEASWTPSLRVVNGESYTWKVWTTADNRTSQEAIATFRVGDQ